MGGTPRSQVSAGKSAPADGRS